MILSVILSALVSHLTDGKIDELFPTVGGSTNLTARYALGGLCVWGAFAALTDEMPEPHRTKARKDVGLAFLLVGVGVSARRIWEAVR